MKKREKWVAWSLPMLSIMLFARDASVRFAESAPGIQTRRDRCRRVQRIADEPHTAISRHARLRGGLFVGFSG